MSYPNDRTNSSGAIPVYIVAGPGKDKRGAASPIKTLAGSTGRNYGPIPVRVVAGIGAGPPFPNDQGNDASAVPVYESVALNAMPVWKV